MMSGRLFTLVGPSGAGKDTLLARALTARPDIHLVRRVITRPEREGDEPFEGVSELEFIRRMNNNQFAFSWQAHGLFYGIPKAELSGLDAGQDVIFNGSRAALPGIKMRHPDLNILLVTASPEIRAKRLAGRGRESEGDILKRLTREAPLAAGLHAITICNDGSLETATGALLQALEPISGKRSIR